MRDTTYDGDTRAVISWNGETVGDGKEFLIAAGAEMVMEDGEWMIDGVFADVAP